jgi:hypothetical protein
MEIESGQREIILPERLHRIEVSDAGILDQENTEYVLTRDLATPGTAFIIRAADITLNLNRHTITYGTQASTDGNSYGVLMDAWNTYGTIVANGAIRQGAGSCEGSYGEGCNPIRTLGGMQEIGGLFISYRSPDTVGIWALYEPAHIHHNTVVDFGTVVTDRHLGIPAITILHAGGGRVAHNTILTRHRGIDLASRGEAAYNTLHINSCATNSYGVFAYDIQDFSVHHNKIYGSGVHPIGIGPISDSGARGQIHANYIEVENTRGGDEEGNTGAAGLRMTWGGNEIVVSQNYIVLRAGNAHPELAGFEDGKSWGRAMWLGGIEAGKTATVRNNHVVALSSDGASYAAGIAVVSGGHNGGLLVTQNTVIANQCMVVLADYYGNAGLYPRFVANTFIRRDRYPEYRTIADRIRGWFDVTAVFVDNRFENGAEISEQTVDLSFCEPSRTDVVFASRSSGVERIAYVLTDDLNRIQSAGTAVPFGECGRRVTPRGQAPLALNTGTR